jgi:hypothetical protein
MLNIPKRHYIFTHNRLLRSNGLAVVLSIREFSSSNIDFDTNYVSILYIVEGYYFI